MNVPIFAVLRVRKLKSRSAIDNADKHNLRDTDVPHCAGDNKLVRRLVGAGQPAYSLLERKLKATQAKRRSDSVLAMEIVLSASPEYFRPGAAASAQEYEHKRMMEWARASMSYAREKWMDNILTIDIHLDESTPHLHIIVTPIAQKERKKRGRDEYYTQNVLDANSLFGRAALSQLQDEYASCLEHLGIQRGIRGSKATHQSVKEFYKISNQSTGTTSKVELPLPPLTNRREWVKESSDLINKELARKDALIEYHRRKMAAVNRNITLLQKIGGYLGLGKWFDLFSRLRKELSAAQRNIADLEVKLSQNNEAFEDRVQEEASCITAHYKEAYSKKCKQLDYYRQKEGKYLSLDR